MRKIGKRVGYVAGCSTKLSLRKHPPNRNQRY